MKQLKHLLSLALVGLFAVSCSMTNSVHFNKDNSGQYSMVLDMQAALEMVSSMDSSGADYGEEWAKDMNIEESDSLIEVIEGVEGLSNAVLDVATPGIIRFGFDFMDIDALNRGVQYFNEMFQQSQAEAGDDEMDMGFGSPTLDQEQVYTAGKKSLTFEASNPLKGDLLDDDGMGGAMSELDGMFDYFFEFSFERQIKSVEHEGFSIVKQDDHSLKAKMELGSLTSGDDRIRIAFKLK